MVAAAVARARRACAVLSLQMRTMPQTPPAPAPAAPSITPVAHGRTRPTRSPTQARRRDRQRRRPHRRHRCPRWAQYNTQERLAVAGAAWYAAPTDSTASSSLSRLHVQPPRHMTEAGAPCMHFTASTCALLKDELTVFPVHAACTWCSCAYSLYNVYIHEKQKTKSNGIQVTIQVQVAGEELSAPVPGAYAGRGRRR